MCESCQSVDQGITTQQRRMEPASSASLCSYEQLRLEIIRRNEEKLATLGVSAACRQLFPPSVTSHPKTKPRPKTTALPQRCSTRLIGAPKPSYIDTSKLDERNFW